MTYTPNDTEMETAGGRYVDLAMPQARDIELHDIAWHLSKLCRYTGAVTGVVASAIYPVAEHAMLVAELVRVRTGSNMGALVALHHDSHEAYTGDISRPMKRRIARSAPVLIAMIEADLQQAIHAALGLPEPGTVVATEIAEADELALAIEAHHLMPSRGRGWGTDGLFDPAVDYGIDTHPWAAATGGPLGMQPDDAYHWFVAAHGRYLEAAMGEGRL